MSAVPDDLAILICDMRHDANNSLMAILGYLELLLDYNDLPDTVTTKLHRIETETRKIADCFERTAFIRRPQSP